MNTYNYMKDKYIDLKDEFVSTVKNDKDTAIRLWNKPLIDYMNEQQRTPLEFTAKDLFVLFLDKYKMTNITSINIYRKDFEDFYNWLIQKGIMGKNICNNEILTTEKITSYIAEKNTIYYEPNDIKEICAWLIQNREYDETIIRSMYEGAVVDLMELAAVKVSDINFRRKTYTNKNGKIRVLSDRLAFLFKVMTTKDEYFTNDDRRFNMVHYEDYLMPIVKTEKNNNTDYVRNTYNNLYYELRRSERKCGRKITGRVLYDSGLLYKVINNLGGKENFVHEMLDKRDSKDLAFALDLADYTMKVSRFKYMYRSYALYFKNQLE